jgi:glycosyltransferase involved in cell wall biosynthesis
MGLENLIEAVASMRKRWPEILAILAGTGPLSEELATRVRDRGLEGHVRLAGFVPDEDLRFAYRAADLSVVPSVALEGFGLIVLESLAAGTPAVVTPVGGLPEVVRGLSPDLVLGGTAPSELAEALSRRLENLSRLPSSAECQRYAREGFDWTVIAARIKKVYENACG